MTGNGKTGINDFGSNVTLDTFNNRVFNHEVFGIAKRFSIGASEVIDIIIDSRSFDKETFVLLPFSILGFDAGPLNVDIYTGTVYTDATGVLWPGIDRNLETPVIPKVFGVYKPTITNVGTKSEAEFLVPSNGTAAVAKIAGSTKEDLLLKLQPGINYMIRITNTTATIGFGSFGVSWFEV
ncbi:hypothetical protein KAR91_02235 [Candidatus Pacearchaeota archaeon]|nr:hypothetical protein [Candidatus Pacearchaeota archaeon]